MNNLSYHDKLKVSARYWLLGMAQESPSYRNALNALEFMLEKHTGLRNGGDPETIHQLRIFHHLRTFHHHLTSPAVKYAAAFLHDTVEDKDVSLNDIEKLFGTEVAEVVGLLTKPKKSSYPGWYLPNIFRNEHASVVKLCDRNDNISTMVGVFKHDRLARYVTETREEFMPRIKVSRRLFPIQEPVYENLKIHLGYQLNLLDALLSYYIPAEKEAPRD